MSDTQNPDIPSGDVGDDDYVSRVGQKTQEPVPVQSDNDTVEAADDDVVDKDSDAQLAQDDTDAIDKSNIIGDTGSRATRGAKPAGGAYTEPGDDEGLPGPEDSGASAVAGGVGSA